MIDHLVVFADRAAAELTLGSPLPGHVILNIGGGNDDSIRVILQDAVWDLSEPQNPMLVTPEVLAQGWYCIVCRPTLDEALRDLPGNACRLIADRDAALSGSTDFLRFVASDTAPEVLATARVEPTPAGSRYPFGSG